MARYDVYAMPGGRGRGFVLDVQAPLLDVLKTRVVAPLLPEAGAPPPIRELNPVFEIEGARYVMLTQAIATVALKELGRAMYSLQAQHDEVTKALDMLLLGF